MRLIDADNLKEFLSISCKNEVLLKQMCDIIDGSPTADVVEVKHGKWELGKSGCMYFCSNCENWAFPREAEEWNYCPRCGAKMDGDNHDK